MKDLPSSDPVTKITSPRARARESSGPVPEVGSKAARKKNSPTCSDTLGINSLAQFDAARPDPNQTRTIANRIINTLNLPHELTPEAENIARAYPTPWTQDALTTTRDKQLRAREGTDPGFTSSPLAYLSGTLARKYETLRIELLKKGLIKDFS